MDPHKPVLTYIIITHDDYFPHSYKLFVLRVFAAGSSRFLPCLPSLFTHAQRENNRRRAQLTAHVTQAAVN